jgi:hypothetical protein
MERPTATNNTPGISTAPAADAIEQRVVALAEQLGRFVGTVQGKADGWMDLPALQEQVTRIRDGAAGLLSQLRTGPAPQGGKPSGKTAVRAKATRTTGTKATRATVGRSGGKVDAPGKKHRKPAPSTRGVKHSDETIPKSNAAIQLRRVRRKG